MFRKEVRNDFGLWFVYTREKCWGFGVWMDFVSVETLTLGKIKFVQSRCLLFPRSFRICGNTIVFHFCVRRNHFHINRILT